MASYYPANTKVRVSVAFTASSTPSDPTTVSLTVTDPAGTATTYTYAGATVTKDGTGAYHTDVTPALEGEWFYAWVGAGAVSAGAEGYFYVG